MIQVLRNVRYMKNFADIQTKLLNGRYEYVEKLMKEICLRYPKHKDRSEQIYLYLSSLTYFSTSHELLKNIQLYQDELMKSPLGIIYLNEVYSYLYVSFQNQEEFEKWYPQKMKQYQRQMKKVNKNKNIYNGYLNLQINQCIFQKQYQKALELLKDYTILNQRDQENYDYTKTYLSYHIEEKTSLLEEYLQQDHLPHYYKKIECLLHHQPFENEEDQEIFKEMLEKYKHQKMKIGKKQRRKQIFLVIFIIILVLCLILLL